jgi:hypothetical protein
MGLIIIIKIWINTFILLYKQDVDPLRDNCKPQAWGVRISPVVPHYSILVISVEA